MFFTHLPLSLWAAEETSIKTEIKITQTTRTQWHVSYKFAEPVQGLELGPSIADYRAKSWKILTPGVQLAQYDGSDLIISNNRLISQLDINISLYSVYPEDHYIPLSTFSDGGVAFYLYHLVGQAITSDGLQPLFVHFSLAPLSGEFVFLPEEANKNIPVYAYFGPQKPVISEHSSGKLALIIDPLMPVWLKKLFSPTIFSKLNNIYRQKLNQQLPNQTLVFLAAGALNDIEGISVKGGAINGQIIFTLRGKSLSVESDYIKRFLLKLIAHEIAHLWQPNSAVNRDKPWFHEGGAEILAVNALLASNLWTLTEQKQFTEQMEIQCTKASQGRSIETTVTEGNYKAVYACGYMLFEELDTDIFNLWSQMLRLTNRQHSVFSMSLIDQILLSK